MYWAIGTVDSCITHAGSTQCTTFRLSVVKGFAMIMYAWGMKDTKSRALYARVSISLPDSKARRIYSTCLEGSPGRNKQNALHVVTYNTIHVYITQLYRALLLLSSCYFHAAAAAASVSAGATAAGVMSSSFIGPAGQGLPMASETLMIWSWGPGTHPEIH